MISLIIKALSAQQALDYATARGVAAQVKGNRAHTNTTIYNQYVCVASDQFEAQIREWFNELGPKAEAPFPYGTLLLFTIYTETVSYTPLTGNDIKVLPEGD